MNHILKTDDRIHQNRETFQIQTSVYINNNYYRHVDY